MLTDEMFFRLRALDHMINDGVFTDSHSELEFSVKVFEHAVSDQMRYGDALTSYAASELTFHDGGLEDWAFNIEQRMVENERLIIQLKGYIEEMANMHDRERWRLQ